MIAKCGHEVDLPGFTPTNFVCQKCFGFAYNLNSYRDIDKRAVKADPERRAA